MSDSIAVNAAGDLLTDKITNQLVNLANISAQALGTTIGQEIAAPVASAMDQYNQKQFGSYLAADKDAVTFGNELNPFSTQGPAPVIVA